jgi:hypothetical protein
MLTGQENENTNSFKFLTPKIINNQKYVAEFFSKRTSGGK